MILLNFWATNVKRVLLGPCLDGENTVYLDIQEKENLSEEIFEVIDNDMEDDNNPLERSAVLTLHS